MALLPYAPPRPEEEQEEYSTSSYPSFKPSLTPEQTQEYIKEYDENPRVFEPSMLDVIGRHATHYKVPFAYNEEDNDGSIGGVIKNIGQGFLEGFTTLPLAGKSKPKNEWEAIGSNLGHLAGFVGYIPGASAVKTLPKLAGMARAIRGKSFPMIAAKAATDKAAKLSNRILDSAQGARAAASGDAINFLQKPVVKDLIEGSFHLGVASSVSSVWGGVDEMMESFIGGAETGLAFRGIGNLIKGFGPAGDKALRSLASSLYTGVPSTLAGQTTPEQIYEYVLGAYFGMNEMPYHRRQGGKFINEKVLRGKYEGMPLETIPGWEKLDNVTQKYVEKHDAVVNRPLGLPISAEIMGSKIFYEKDGTLITDPKRIAERTKEIVETAETGETQFKDLVETSKIDKVEGTHDYRVENLDFEPVDTIKNKVKYYVDENKPIYTKKDVEDGGVKLEAYQNIQGKWNQLINTFRANEKETGTGFIQEGKKKYDHPEQLIREYITKKYKVSTAEEYHYNFWRNWGNRQLREDFVPQMSLMVKADGTYESMNMRDNYTFGAKEKIIREERKLIDDIWAAANEAAGRPVSPNERAYKILDHVTVQLPTISKRSGELITKDYDFKNWKESVGKEEGVYQSEKQKLYSFNYKAQDAEGYYYYGGKGDAQRQYFLRYHPTLGRAQAGEIRNKVDEIVEKVGGKKFVADLAKDRAEFISEYSGAGKSLTKQEAENLYNKSFLSNMFYTYEMNGKKAPVSVRNIIPEEFRSIFVSAGNKVIGNAKAFNKRQQVWFSSGMSATKSFMQNRKDLNLGGTTDTPTFRYLYVNDKDGTTKKEDQANLKKTAPASEWKEIEDGGLIGRSDWVRALNRDAGLPVDGGFNKSFIVSPDANYGALLGKYGVHTASKKMDAWMKKNNVHFIINTSSAKQAGTRIPQDHRLEKNDLKFSRGVGKDKKDEDPFIYDLPVEHIKTVYSEHASIEGSLKNTRIPKQLLSNLTPYAFSKINPKSIDNMYEAINQKAMTGEAEINTKLDKFLSNPKANEAMIETLVENMDRIGLPKMLQALHDQSPTGQKLASRMYDKILRVNREIESEKTIEGEITPEEAQQIIRQTHEFNSIHERILRLLPDSVAGHLHKFTTPVRGAAIRNYVVNQVTRPKIGNSGSFRLRIWDKGLQQRTDKEGNTSLLAKKDDIFFLDDGWKNHRIQTEFRKKPYTLEELWIAVRDKQTGIPLARAREVLNAVVVRTPMDSLSGAQVLKFQGFTGIEGTGGLIHPRKTRALGGADLDGDKAAVFFGDEAHGMRKSWKKMYKDQADEYVKKDGRETSNKDPKYKDELAEKDDGYINKMMESEALVFSPHRRQLASDASSEGRGMLGLATTTKASITGAHASVASLPARTEEVQYNIKGDKVKIKLNAGEYLYQIHVGSGAVRWVKMKAHTDATSLEKGREIGRTAVALGSDPMDEAGLKGKGAFFDAMANKVFSWTVYKPSKKGGGIGSIDHAETKKIQRDDDIARAQRRKPIQLFQSANSAMYARNYQEGRRYYYNEVRDRLDALTDPSRLIVKDVDIRQPGTSNIVGSKRITLYTPGFAEEHRNTLLSKVAADVRRLDYGDSVFTRFDQTAVSELYTSHANDVAAKKYTWLQKALNRDRMTVPESKVVSDIYQYELHTYEGYRRQLNPSTWSLNLSPETNYRSRGRWLADYVRRGEDFLINDMSDMVSFRLIQKYADQVGDKSRVLAIHKATEVFKRKSDDHYKEIRGGNVSPQSILEEYKSRGQEISKKEANELYKIELDIAKQGASDIVFKTNLDNAMKRYKGELETDAQQKLFDQLMLGTFERGGTQEIKNIIKKFPAARRAKPKSMADKRSMADKFDKRVDDYFDIPNRVQFPPAESIEKAHAVVDGKKVPLTEAQRDQLVKIVEGKGSFILAVQGKADAALYRLGSELIDQQSPRKTKYEEPKDRIQEGSLQEHLKSLEERSKATHLSRVGFSSTAVSDASLKEYLQSYDKMFSKAQPIGNEEVQRIKDEANVSVEVKSIVDENGERVKIQSVNTNNLDRTQKKYIDEIAPFEGLTKGKLKKEEAELASSIIDHISNHFGNSPMPGVEFNQFVRGVMEKDVNAMSFRDWKAFDMYLKEIRNGSFIAKHLGTMKNPEKFPELAKRHQYQFPEANNKELMRYEIKRIETIGTWTDKRGNIVTGTVQKPTQIINELRDLYHKSQELTSAGFDIEKKKMEDELAPYLYGLDQGAELYRVSGAMMERFGQVRLEDNLNNLPVGKYLKDQMIKHAGEPGKLKAMMSEYSKMFREAIKESNWHGIKNKNYIVTHLVDGKSVTQNLTGAKVVQRLIEVREKQNERYFKWLSGDPKLASKYLGKLETVEGGGDKKVAPKRIAQLKELRRMFIEDVQKMTRLNKNIPMELGVDNLRRVTRYLQLNQLVESKQLGGSGLLRELERVPSDVGETGQISSKYYVPHMMFDRKEASQSMLRYIDAISKDPKYGNDIKKKEADLKSAIIRFKQLTGDWVSSDQLTTSWGEISNVLSGIGQEKKALLDSGFKQFMKNRKVGSQFSRDTHIGGWSYEPQAYETYVKNIMGSFNKQIAEIGARDATFQFRKDYTAKVGDKELVNRWGDYLDLYSQEAGGAPVNIPKHILENPAYKVKGTAYAWFADNVWVKRMNKLREKLGFEKRAVEKGTPKELEAFDFNSLRKFGQLEAKYQLASLLAHPKSMVANLYGGTVHTLISTGYQNFRNARNINFLRLKINPKWEKMDDVYEWVKSHGVVEEFLMYEANINPQVQSKAWQKTINDVVKKLKRDPDMSDKSMFNIASKYGISESVFNKAAWFMRRPERTLRRDAFVAHYLKAREKFGGMISDYNNATLIEMAKKGVKGTQFLYSAPFRPAFARSNVGKVFTRFQIWAWNSVRFRNDVIREAKIRGFNPGTDEYDRFKRLAVADMFMLGLANMFPYSIFEAALPSPWNWFEDTAAMMFGDERERDRAFFGSYPAPLQPLQLITPPALRLLPPLFKGMVTDDYSRMSEYYLWTMAPFGRMFRDVAGPGGILENPSRTVEKLTGLPYMGFARRYKEEQEEERRRPQGPFTRMAKLGTDQEV